MKLKSFASAVVLAACASGAWANPAPIADFSSVSGGLVKYFDFMLTGATDVTSYALDFGVVDGSYLLFLDAGTPGHGQGDVELGGDNFGAASPLFFGSLAAGNYYFKTLAVGTGSQLFTASFTTPVPEPETYAMMLAGLGAIGFMARRRQVK